MAFSFDWCSRLAFARLQNAQAISGSSHEPLGPWQSLLTGVQGCRLPSAAAPTRHSGRGLPFALAFKAAVCDALNEALLFSLRHSGRGILFLLAFKVAVCGNASFPGIKIIKPSPAALTSHSGRGSFLLAFKVAVCQAAKPANPLLQFP